MCRLFSLLIALLLLNVIPAHAISVISSNGRLLHESNGNGAIENLVEDVLFLLPEEMSKSLASHYDTLLAAARFNPRNSYFSYRVTDMNRFKENYYSLAARYVKSRSAEDLARMLGNTIKDIVEISMQSSKYDPTNENLKLNMHNFFYRVPNNTYTVASSGCGDRSFDAIVADICDLRKLNKESVYPYLVTHTAELWTSIWITAGNKPTIRKQAFVRQPPQIRQHMWAYTPMVDANDSIIIRDSKESAIVSQYGDNYNGAVKIMEKRYVENVKSIVNQIQAEAEHSKYKREHNIRDDYEIVNTDSLKKAVDVQGDWYRKNGNPASICRVEAVPKASDSLSAKVQSMEK